MFGFRKSTLPPVAPVPSPDAVPSGVRDLRLDLFRGLCLIMIYVNHVPGTVFETLTTRNFGLSDAAEGFVFMSGCSVALAYEKLSRNGLSLGAVRKAWGRAWQLYLVHLMTTVWAMALVAGGVLWLGADEVLKDNSFMMMWRETVQVVLGVAILGHQFGYVNILPMYAVLMLGAPFLLRLGQRSPKALIAFSLLLWALTAELKLNLPNYPQAGGWFFNPFAWQLIFCLGILTGLALRQRQRFVPEVRWLVWLALGWLLFCLVWTRSPELKDLLNTALARLVAEGVPQVVAGFDKTYVSLPRLSHFLALAYVLSLPGLIPMVAALRAFEPIRLIGRHSLPVFALGTIVAIFAQVVKDVHPAGFEQDLLLILGGVFLQWALAWAIEWCRANDIAAAPPVRSERAPEPIAAGAARKHPRAV